MMYVTDAPGPSQDEPKIDEEYLAIPGLDSEEGEVEEGEVEGTEAAPAEDEYVPPEETEDGLKTPEFAQATDDEVPGEPKPAASEKKAEIVDKVEGLLDAIGKGAGDVEQAAADIVWEIDKKDVPDAKKVITLGALVKINNSKDATKDQRGAVEHAFSLIRSESSEKLFRFGMLASANLADDQKTLASFIKTYAERGHADGKVDLASDEYKAFLKSVETMAEKNPQITKELIDQFMELWFENPGNSAFLWNALMAIAETGGSYKITIDSEEEEKIVVTEYSDGVKSAFFAEYDDEELDEEKKIEFASGVVAAMRDDVPEVHIEIVRKMIKMGPDSVRRAMLDEAAKLHSLAMKGKISVDSYAMRKCFGAFIDQHEKGCFVEKGKCEGLGEDLMLARGSYAPILDLSFGGAVRNISDLYGEPMKHNIYGLGVSFEWISSEFDSGARLLVGAHFTGWKDNRTIGVRVGTALAGGPVSLKLAAALEYMYLKRLETGLDDIPVKLMNPQTTPDGTAYRMEPTEMEFIMNAGALVVRPELDIVIHRWHIGGGQSVGLKAFISFQAGLFAGGVYDDGCTYSYDPMSANEVEVSPQSGNTAIVTQSAELGTRCRANKPVFGTIFGAEAGLALEFGL